MSTVRVDRAISVRQPWAFAIAAGFKPIENRGAWCNYRGPVAIHASLQVADYVGWPQREAAVAYQAAGAGANLWQSQYPPLPSKFRSPPDPRLALGGVIAVVEIVGCHYAVGHGDVPPSARGRNNSTTCCPDWGQWWYRSNPTATPKHAVHIELANVQPLSRAVHMRGRLGVPWRMNDAEVAAVMAAADEAPAVSVTTTQEG